MSSPRSGSLLAIGYLTSGAALVVIRLSSPGAGSLLTVLTSASDSSILRSELRAPSPWKPQRLHEGMPASWGSSMNSTLWSALVVAGMAAALRPGGRLALSAFNAYFAVKYHADAEFDADTGVSHERTEIRSESGELKTVDLWTGCYTPRELRLLLGAQGFAVDAICSVEPGQYGSHSATTESPEFLVIASR
jgi:hypothetical protein